ncbi:hypothetical protein KDH_27490 [Dictyobacter sp. S3.2.2.5]|uniref:Cyanobacterial TRADD-N associated 2 transmembrane domain-containing protein n=1 Tax=Dictyobacter halimunensis TaxID=3026934 RepID=A0ABQ6FQE6_9CHLR|nr:hypothetical protein KDH_27490 [Dictyobacter sp. S3.2.2.5]
MDWKDLLPALLEEKNLDVRFICIKHKGEWFLKRLRATIFRAEPGVPEQVLYPSYLFFREKMGAADFIQFLNDVTTRRISPEGQASHTEEEKLKKLSLHNWEISYEVVNVSFSDHMRGHSMQGLADHLLPCWNFGGNLWPEIQETQESLIASGTSAPYFPRPIDGQAWYLYEKALQVSNNYLPLVDISLEDDRAFFRNIEINEEAGTARCQCEGTLLSQATISLYTATPQMETKRAASEIIFQLQEHPAVISLALTYADSWLDKRDVNLEYHPLGVPKGVTVVGGNFRESRGWALGGGVIADPTSAIEKIAQADPSNLATIVSPNLEMGNSYYLNTLNQSRQSFSWALVGEGVVIAFFIAAVILFTLRLPGNASYLAPLITALAGGVVQIATGVLFKFYSSASDQTAACHNRLDRIQRFFIANSACEHLNEVNKSTTQVALIKKLNDLQ